MKKCPSCGYEPPKRVPKSDSPYFPGMPIKQMIKRGWIGDIDIKDPHAVLAELMKFSGSKTLEEFKKEWGYEGELLDVANPQD